jgi:Arc/MetJ-type ribon-helix-helix transcriptional regulator
MNLRRSRASRSRGVNKVARRILATRVPLTITLGPESYRFIEACAQRGEFRNIDELFEAALITYQRQSEAVRAYTELQIDKGYSREEILQSLQLEFVITRPSNPEKRKRRS